MHIDSHYAATLCGQPDFESLHGNISAQTCVIGGGFAGLTTACELVRKGHDVVLLEAELVGWGASGRSSGFVSAGFARSLSSIAEAVGWANTKRLFQLSRRGRDYVHDTIADLDLGAIILGNGWLKLLRHGDASELLQTRDLMGRRFGVEWDFIKGDSLDSFVKSDAYFAGLYDRQSFHIQPLQYACGLASEINNRGGRIFEHTRCDNLQKAENSRNGQWKIGSKHGSVSAENVVLATSAYGGPLAKLNGAMIPVSTYVVSSAPCAWLLNDVIPFTGCIADTRRSGDYYRAIGEGNERRLIWGGRITTLRTQPTRLATMLKHDIARVYPQLTSIRIERAWSGLMGYATHKMPIIAKLGDGLWAATAFGGQGLNTCAMAGQLISAAISDGDDEYRLFESFGPRWSGGLLGRLAVQLEYWRLQYLDRRDEKRSLTG